MYQSFSSFFVSNFLLLSIFYSFQSFYNQILLWDTLYVTLEGLRYSILYTLLSAYLFLFLSSIQLSFTNTNTNTNTNTKNNTNTNSNSNTNFYTNLFHLTQSKLIFFISFHFSSLKQNSNHSSYNQILLTYPRGLRLIFVSI